MPKSKQQKEEILKNLEEKISRAKSIVFAGFDALGVVDNDELRNKLRSENSEYYVAKKTLLDRAFSASKIEGLNTLAFEGKVAALFSYEDEIASAKILGEFKKKKERKDKVVFLAGVLEGKLLSQSEVEALSLIPSKPELYANIVGSLNAPISGFVNVMAGNLRGLLNVLKAVSESK